MTIRYVKIFSDPNEEDVDPDAVDGIIAMQLGIRPAAAYSVVFFFASEADRKAFMDGLETKQ